MERNKVLLFLNGLESEKIETAFFRANFDVICPNKIKEIICILQDKKPHILIIESSCLDKNREIEKYIYGNCQDMGLIILTNKDKNYRIQALEKGADGCLNLIPKTEELIAKSKALLRRMEIIKHTPKIVKVRDIEINLDMHEVRKGGRPVDLTYIQFKLLYLLASHRDYVYTRDEILDKVWGENTLVTNRTVDVHIKRLREKLGEPEQSLKYIQTIHGLGYRFSMR